jgi:hypothetical protein
MIKLMVLVCIILNLRIEASTKASLNLASIYLSFSKSAEFDQTKDSASEQVQKDEFSVRKKQAIFDKPSNSLFGRSLFL